MIPDLDFMDREKIGLIESKGALDYNLAIRPVVGDRYPAGEVMGEDGTIVVVAVVGPSNVPMSVKQARAEVKAVESLGVMNVSVSNVKDILENREVVRITEVEGYEVEEDDIDYIKKFANSDILKRVNPAELELVTFQIRVSGEYPI